MSVAQNKLAAAWDAHQKGNLPVAEKQYRAVLRSQPENADALYLLGMLCFDTERWEMAAGFLDRAIRAAEMLRRPVDPQWRLACGSAWQRADRQEKALANFDRALSDDPNSVDALFCRGTALQSLERLDEAIEAYKVVLDRNPHHAEAAYNFGVTLRDAKKPEIAQKALQKAILLKPDYAEAYEALAPLMEDLGWREDALAVYKRAIELQPDKIGLITAYSRALMTSNKVEEAEEVLLPLLEKHPDMPALQAQYASVRLFRGDRKSAARIATEIIEKHPEIAAAHYTLAQAERDGDHEARISGIEANLAEGVDSREGEAALEFALATRYEALKRYEDAFEHYIGANSCKRQALEERGVVYDRGAEEAYTDRMIAAYPGLKAFAGPVGSDSEVPVFIVGMPRSGTTLTEQILTSHPRMAGAGELTAIGNAVKRLAETLGYPRNPPTEKALENIASLYLQRLREVDAEALRVTDKMPGNFHHLGLIARIFPKARIIHCRRNPVDNCLSCFVQNFGAEGLSWSFDLEDAAHQYREYHRLMEHWRNVLPPGLMLEIDYEETVGNLEGQARKLVDFVGVEWDDACLSFHENKRAVITASHDQVRRPIYNTSVGRWKRYGPKVLRLVDALSDFLDEAERPERLDGGDG
jgi:tetratricopeptide (TPR) repeat protein